jgi:hypothetical protein
MLAAMPDRIGVERGDFEVETLDYADANGTAKRVLAAHRAGRRNANISCMLKYVAKI